MVDIDTNKYEFKKNWENSKNLTKEKYIPVTQKNMYYNSECLFIEYNDVIKSPMFSLIKIVKDMEKMRNIFNFSNFDNMTDDEIYEWYINRKNINFYKDMKFLLGEPPTEEIYYNMIKDQLLSNNIFYEISPKLSFFNTLFYMATIDRKLIKNIIIYSEFENKKMEEDMRKILPNTGIQFASGNFLKVIAKVPNDSTFVFSDITKINDMANINKLEYASVLIANGYRYNYDDNLNLKINLEELSKKIVFKYNFFQNQPIIENNIV